MKVCKCYDVTYEIIGWFGPDDKICKQRTRCNGTREQDECSCGGDRAKCDFYPEVRETALKEVNICHLCDSHKGCDNCYYGQVDTRVPHGHCEGCDSLPTGDMSEWEPLGDNYCRNCGRKLK